MQSSSLSQLQGEHGWFCVSLLRRVGELEVRFAKIPLSAASSSELPVGLVLQ